MSATKLGLKVLIFDGDMGLANVDVVLGLLARYNIRQVLDGHVQLREIIVEGPEGIKVIPSGSGISSLTQLSYTQKQFLMEQMSQLDGLFDLVLIDTGAGIADNVIHLNSAADEVIVVTTPEPHAMTDAYATIKVLAENDRNTKVGLLVNMTRTLNEGAKVFDRIADVAKQFIGFDISYLGSVPMDPQVTKSVYRRQAISAETIHTLSGQAWNSVTRNILERKRLSKSKKADFWGDLLWHEGRTECQMKAGSL